MRDNVYSISLIFLTREQYFVECLCISVGLYMFARSPSNFWNSAGKKRQESPPGGKAR